MREEHFDVVVVGAGVAGVAAAVSAGRNGAKTVLVESGVCAGGLGSAGLVPSFTPFSYKKESIVGGIAAEIYARLRENDGSNLGSWPYIDAEMMKFVCDEMLCEADMDVRYLTTFCGVEKEGRLIRRIQVLDRQGMYFLSGDNFIDTTGDGALSMAAGVQMQLGDGQGNSQAGATCFALAGADASKMSEVDKAEQCTNGMFYLTNTLRCYLAKWLDEGKLRNTENFQFHVAGGSLDIQHGIVRLNFGHHYGLGVCDPKQLSKMLISGRRKVREFVQCLRENMPGMENVYVIHTPSLPDIRESRHIIGRTVMDASNFWEGKKHDDDIAIYDYYIDVHARSIAKAKGEGSRYTYASLLDTAINKYYGISFGICLTNEFDNLAVAGRCVSATPEMLGALRVMPAAMSTGQAVGTAAAMSKIIASVNIPALQKKLADAGVILNYR